MGSWFSNIHIRKNNTITLDDAQKSVCQLLKERGYSPVATEDEADGAVVIVSDDSSRWFSFFSELIAFEEPEQLADMAMPISRQLQTDVLGISCFDSDYLYLNLLNAKEKINAWVGIGSAGAYDIRRRTNLPAWKTKVEDFESFSEFAREKYVFAEEFLCKVEENLLLPSAYSAANAEDLQEFGLDQGATYLYFKFGERNSAKLLNVAVSEEKLGNTQLTTNFGFYHPPCFTEQMCGISVENAGGASKGLKIYFLGPYVEHDEITFSDTVFRRMRNGTPESVPFALEKVQLSDGQWAYCYHDPDYEIPPRPPKLDALSLKELQKVKVDREYGITIAFIPHGNRRKILDITVAFVPDENPEGQVRWNVWQHLGSKELFFKNNRLFANLPGCERMLLREEDFD